jgi:hypothetical protein
MASPLAEGVRRLEAIYVVLLVVCGLALQASYKSSHKRAGVLMLPNTSFPLHRKDHQDFVRSLAAAMVAGLLERSIDAAD